MVDFVVSHFNYWSVVILMMVGLYIVFATGNLVKRLVGLGVFQTSVFLFYISMGKVAGGKPPILPEHHGDKASAPSAAGAGAGYAVDGAGNAGEATLGVVYSNPLPHVLILTAIVVGVATLAVGLALVVRIREAYETIEDDDITAKEYDDHAAGADA